MRKLAKGLAILLAAMLLSVPVAYAAGPSYVDGAVSYNSGTNNLTANMPASIVSGNLLILFVDMGTNGSTFTPAAGTGATWTLLGSAQNAPSIFYSASVFWKIANGTEPSTFAITSNGFANMSATVLQITGNSATPIDVSSVNNPDTGGSSPVSLTATGVTTSGANELLVAIGGVVMSSATAPTWSTPAGYTLQQTNSGGTSQNNSSTFFTQLQATAGASGNATWTATVAGDTGGFMAWLIAVAGTGGGGSVLFSNGKPLLSNSHPVLTN